MTPLGGLAHAKVGVEPMCVCVLGVGLNHPRNQLKSASLKVVPQTRVHPIVGLLVGGPARPKGEGQRVRKEN